MKPLLTVDELITHMKNKGIKFNIVAEEEAKSFLSKNNYYMKLASYRFNYKKYKGGANDGKYIDLDFAYLKELSTIDMYLRYIVVEMALDIEHSLKVRLLNHIENNPNEDGYKIIRDFLSSENNKTFNKILSHKSSIYCKGLIDKYQADFPVWVFVELISFGSLTHLCEFYNKKYNVKIADNILLNSVKDIRNASAHSNCLINNLSTGNNVPHTSVVNRVKNIEGISPITRKKKLKNKFIYDFICLLFAYDEIVCSTKMKQRIYEQLEKLFDKRMTQNGYWFKSNNLITSSYDFIRIVLDNLISK